MYVKKQQKNPIQNKTPTLDVLDIGVISNLLPQQIYMLHMIAEIASAFIMYEALSPQPLLYLSIAHCRQLKVFLPKHGIEYKTLQLYKQ